jgi:hypothetical protein
MLGGLHADGTNAVILLLNALFELILLRFLF